MRNVDTDLHSLFCMFSGHAEKIRHNAISRGEQFEAFNAYQQHCIGSLVYFWRGRFYLQITAANHVFLDVAEREFQMARESDRHQHHRRQNV